MTAFLERESASDLDLISAARDGDDEAVAELYVRHHDAAARYARGLADPTTAEDLVAEAFAQVLESVRRGGGPEVAFRPYLLRTVHNVYVKHVRRDSRHTWVEDADELDRPLPVDAVEERRESALLAAAFASLPERWQTVLWHTSVEREDHETVGRLLGLKANAVAALAFRSRDGLRRAYLEAHLGDLRDEACRPFREALAPYARGRLHGRRRGQLEEHLAQCPDCTAGYLELHALGTDLGAVLAPAVLGGGAIAYAAGATATVGAGGAGLFAGRGLRSSLTVGAAAAVVVAVAVGSFAYVAVSSDSVVATADPAGAPGPVTAPPSVAPTPSATPSATPSVPPTPTPTPVEAAIVPTPAVRATPTPRPTPTQRPTPRPTPTPTPTQAPTAPPSSPPTATPTTPVATPSETPPLTVPTDPASGTPTDTPTSTPTVGPVTTLDLGLGAASYAYYEPHFHLQMEVTAPLDPTVLTIDVAGLTSFSVHVGPAYLHVTCAQTGSQAGPTADVARLTCEVPAGQGPFAIDLTVAGALDATVRVSAAGNDDPDPSNDVVTVHS